tara:strand:+ start:252 stop:659 length:408 start_codon:yes stop_codon:yes gene_type:complete
MTRFRLLNALLLAASVLAGGCASTAGDVTARPVPMTAYEAFECQELASEYERVHTEAEQLAAVIDRGAMAERIKMGVGVVLFWPALLLIDGENENHAQLASLKGERLALLNSMKARNCPLNQRHAFLSAEPNGQS